MPEQVSGRIYTLQQLITQLLLATVCVREGELAQREGAAEPAGLEEARRRRRGFAAMLTEAERRDVRASFRTLLSDLPDTTALPFSTADAPELYPLVSDVYLFESGGSGSGAVTRPVVAA